jgi:Ni/Fe-hydrogenase subunit HybB-like protein
MVGDRPEAAATLRETLIFFAKLAAYLLALTAFGLVIYWLRRKLG